MFCSSLRKRPLWRTLGPLVASASTRKFQESKLETHDVALPLPYGSPAPGLTVLILDPESMDEACLSSTVARVQLFTDSAKEKRGVITLVLNDGREGQTSFKSLQALMQLQTILFDCDISCPVLPIPDISFLLPTLEDYLKGIQPSTRQTTAQPMFNSLVSQATASAPAKPLSEHDANVISDIFSSLKDFGGATRTQQGRAKLYNFLDPTTAEEVVDFWADEWIV